MRRLFVFLLAALVAVSPSWAVLKERDLARTLGVLRAELQADYRRQQAFKARYEQQGAAQHEQLVWYMNQCEQIGLMLYSQAPDNTFDMAYACQQAVNLYRQLDSRSGRSLPYDKIIAYMRHEIERYDSLIMSLNSIPPVLNQDSLSESDSHLLGAIDSLAARVDTAMAARPDDEARPLTDEVPEEGLHEPLYLTGQQLQDRLECIGYATVLRERGVTVSGGQKQRISIARALMREAPILILDDSVSAVDTKTEKTILENLRETRRGKTTLLIAHRITTIEKMDKILFIDDGRLAAMGSHEELLESCAEYRKMVELQKLEEEGGMQHA